MNESLKVLLRDYESKTNEINQLTKESRDYYHGLMGLAYLKTAEEICILMTPEEFISEFNKHGNPVTKETGLWYLSYSVSESVVEKVRQYNNELTDLLDDIQNKTLDKGLEIIACALEYSHNSRYKEDDELDALIAPLIKKAKEYVESACETVIGDYLKQKEEEQKELWNLITEELIRQANNSGITVLLPKEELKDDKSIIDFMLEDFDELEGNYSFFNTLNEKILGYISPPDKRFSKVYDKKIESFRHVKLNEFLTAVLKSK